MCFILTTFWGVLASIFGLTATDSSFTGSSLASSVSDGTADDPAADAPPVTSSLSF